MWHMKFLFLTKHKDVRSSNRSILRRSSYVHSTGTESAQLQSTRSWSVCSSAGSEILCFVFIVINESSIFLLPVTVVSKDMFFLTPVHRRAHHVERGGDGFAPCISLSCAGHRRRLQYYAPVSQLGGVRMLTTATRQAAASISDWCLSSSRMQGAKSRPLTASVANVPAFVATPATKEQWWA